MGYTIRKMGQLFLDEQPQLVPKNPVCTGDIPSYLRGASISFRDAAAGQDPITWIRPDGMNLLVADRCLLSKVSWDNLQSTGFVDGVPVELGGNRYLCRLLQVSAEEEGSDEWDTCLDTCGEEPDLWHWKDMFFWGQETASHASYRAVRGWVSARYWFSYHATTRGVRIGFRPTLVSLGTDSLPSDKPSETGCPICKGRSHLQFRCDVRMETSDGVVRDAPVPVQYCPFCGQKFLK